MKIAKIDLIRLFGKSGRKHGKFTPIVVRIWADDGTCGLGEAGFTIGRGANAVCGAIRDLVPLVIGQDIFCTEKIWNNMQRGSLWALDGGCVHYGAISAIDCALWDLKAKALGVPLYKLLGGKCRETLTCYASQLQFGWAGEAQICASAKALAEAAQQAVSQGYVCLKLDPIGYDTMGIWNGISYKGPLGRDQINLAVNRMEAVRTAVGDSVELILENHCFTDATSAVALAKALEPCGILWMEEPADPLLPDALAHIKLQTSVPLACGEKLATRQRFAPLLAGGLIDVAQPDVSVCGGITEAKKICDMASAYGTSISLHHCHGPIALAHALHLESALPHFFLHEVHRTGLIQENIALGEYPHLPIKGSYTIPDLPGIGQQLSETALRHGDIVTIS